MGNVKTIFCSTYSSKTNTELQVHLADNNELLIEIEKQGNENPFDTKKVHLDKHSAILLVRHLKKFIGYLEYES